jgi:hypothetical protein
MKDGFITSLILAGITTAFAVMLWAGLQTKSVSSPSPAETAGIPVQTSLMNQK